MIEIRKGTHQDLPGCLQLIKELAIYEKEPEAVIVTQDQFSTYFQEQRFDLIVATEQNEIVGMALFYEAYSTWKGKYLYLDDFVVTEKARRKGIGKQIFDAVLREVAIRELAFLKWQVLAWNTPAIDFYDKYPISKDNTWVDCKYFPNAHIDQTHP